MADLTPDQKAAAEAEAAAKAQAAAEAEAAAKAQAAVPSPPVGADFDAVATMHTRLVAEQSPHADAFHKKHVLGFKPSKK